MRRWCIGTVFVSLLLIGTTKANSPISPSEIFTKNKNAVVRIFVGGTFKGCGFIVSGDGLIVTANHVITDPESTEPLERIEVQQPGSQPHFATVIDYSPFSDTALLHIVGDGFPHTEIAKTEKGPAIGEQATIVTFLPNSDLELLVSGPIAGKGVITAGYMNAMAIISQVPVRKGFSGSPMFDERGHVVGIVNTRLIGISPDLDAARKELSYPPEDVGMVMTVGVDLGQTLRGLIENLDAHLVSGLGSAVNISYVQEMISKNQANRKLKPQ